MEESNEESNLLKLDNTLNNIENKGHFELLFKIEKINCSIQPIKVNFFIYLS
jgi:hypothetical protein